MTLPVLELLFGGLLLGGVYALMASGLNLIFGVMKVINFAHGDILAVGALLTVTLAGALSLPYPVAIIVVPLVTAGLGWLIQTTLIRRVADGPMIMSLLATYGVSVVLVNAAILIWGGRYQGLPGVIGGSFQLLGVNVSVSRAVAFAVAMATCLGVWALLRATRFGRAIRAVSQAPELATISGISVSQVRNAAFALGSGMAGLAGVLLAPSFASDPQMGARFAIKTFAVVVVGGMGSYPGAIIGALALGVIEVFAGWWLGAVIGGAILYLIMIATLLVRPRGLLGAPVRS